MEDLQSVSPAVACTMLAAFMTFFYFCLTASLQQALRFPQAGIAPVVAAFPAQQRRDAGWVQTKTLDL